MEDEGPGVVEFSHGPWRESVEQDHCVSFGRDARLHVGSLKKWN
jgi:hypothetical protein